ncbi:MAG: DegT/DnrJ/EryC1/StrS family aminotransferase [Acidobacteria bacterium]|nr:DegT/DnrJ/EryC1/StrS family aminotransferase [Acidobacteriota bacterium]
MSLWPRLVPPAGAPLTAVDVGRWLRAAARADAPDSLAAWLRHQTGAPWAFTISNGRSGLSLTLSAFADLAGPSRTEVIVPAYACYTIAASVVRAGLTVRLVDIDPATLDYDEAALARVDTARALAIVATNLYGLPSNLPRLDAFAQASKLFLLDDAAQALGARVGGRASGTWGDAGIYSFDKGKNVPAVEGGAIVTGSEAVARAIERRVAALPPAPLAKRLRQSAVAVASAVLIRPSLYWIPNAIPQLGLGQTIYDPAFTMSRMGREVAGLARVMADRLEAFAAVRQQHAAQILAGLHGVHGVRPIRPLADSTPAYLRLPLLAESAAARDRDLAVLRRAGIGASASYPASMVEVPALRPHLAAGSDAVDGARHVARHILTLPTHPLVRGTDISRMLATLAAADAAASPLAAHA